MALYPACICPVQIQEYPLRVPCQLQTSRRKGCEASLVVIAKAVENQRSVTTFFKSSSDPIQEKVTRAEVKISTVFHIIIFLL